MEKLNSIENLLRQNQSLCPTVQVSESGVQDIMNFNQACAYTTISKSAMYKHTSNREIPHFKTRKRIYMKKTELDQWLTTNKIMSRNEIDQEANNYLMKHKRKW